MLLNQNHTVCPKIETEFLGSSETPTFFQPKNRWSPKKKKVFTEIETNFPAKIGNSDVFSAQKQVVSKKKKIVFTEIQIDFPAKIGNSNAFSGRITTCTSQLRHPIFFGGGGGVSNFSPKIGLKSTKNVRFFILHKPLGGLEPPSPPWLRYCLQAKYCNYSKITECCFKLRKQLINIWMFLKSKKNSVLFRFCSFTMLQKSKKVFAQPDRAFGIGLQNNF